MPARSLSRTVLRNIACTRPPPYEQSRVHREPNSWLLENNIPELGLFFVEPFEDAIRWTAAKKELEADLARWVQTWIEPTLNSIQVFKCSECKCRACLVWSGALDVAVSSWPHSQIRSSFCYVIMTSRKGTYPQSKHCNPPNPSHSRIDFFVPGGHWRTLRWQISFNANQTSSSTCGGSIQHVTLHLWYTA